MKLSSFIYQEYCLKEDCMTNIIQRIKDTVQYENLLFSHHYLQLITKIRDPIEYHGYDY